MKLAGKPVVEAEMEACAVAEPSGPDNRCAGLSVFERDAKSLNDLSPSCVGDTSSAVKKSRLPLSVADGFDASAGEPPVAVAPARQRTAATVRNRNPSFTLPPSFAGLRS